jgi:beta-phosphoglucomutase
MHSENIIFDFDGVIVNSEPAHAAAKKLALTHYSINYEDQLFDRFKGIPDADFFKHVSAQLTKGAIPAVDLLDLKRKHYANLFPEINLVEGILTFISQTKEKGVRIAIASSTTRRDFLLIDEKYNLSRLFDVVVTGDDTLKHKPHPEPYLKAAASCSALKNHTCLMHRD